MQTKMRFLIAVVFLLIVSIVPTLAQPGMTSVTIDLILNEVLVEFDSPDGALTAEEMHAIGKLKEIGRLTHRDVSRYLITSSDGPFDLIPRLEALPGVVGAYPNYKRYAQFVPQDSLYNLQKVYYDLLNMEKVWDIETGSAQVVVAVIDTGVDPTHPDLAANLIAGANTVGDGAEEPDYVMDDSGHGTAVAGVIGAIGNNSKGVTGMTWNVRIMPIRACWGPSLTCSIWDEVEAIDIARVAKVDIINMSIGGMGTMTLEEKAASDAWAAGIVMFAAAGNKSTYLKATGTPADRQNLYYPASLPEVVGVGALDNNLVRADFSNYGEVVSAIYAPGVEIISTIPEYEVSLFPDPGPPYGKLDGTSFSCPMVAGVAVLLKSHFPELSNEEIVQRIYSTAIPLGSTDADQNGIEDFYGHGLVNPVAALSPPKIVGSEYFEVGVSGSPIFEDDIYVFVEVKKAITGAPLVTYNIDALDIEGTVEMKHVGTGNFYMGTFNTTYNGQIRVGVTGFVGGELLPPITLLYIVKDI